MSMGKKDYIAIAKIIRKRMEFEPEHRATLQHLTLELATYFRATNKLFDQDKFLEAAGYNIGKENNK